MLHAIERIRAHGLRTAALTNNWADDRRPGVAARLRRARRSTSSSSRRSRGCASPTRASTSSYCDRLGVRAAESVFLDDLGINLKPARAHGHDDDQGRPTPTSRSAELEQTLGFESCDELTTRRRAVVQILWVRHAEPERVAPGSGVPANPPLTALGRVQAKRLGRLARARAGRRDRVEPATARAARPPRRSPTAHGLEIEIVDGLVRVRRAVRPLHPDGGAARRRRTTRWHGDGRRPLGGVRRRATRRRSATRVDATRRRGDRRAPGRHGRRGLPRRRRSTSRSRRCSASTQHLWFEPGYTSVSRMSASRTGVRSVAVAQRDRAPRTRRGRTHEQA